MTRSPLSDLLAGFPGRRVLVVGDVMLDEFIWGEVRRISPEAPVPVVEVMDETYRLGGSGNVAANIQELGGKAIPLGIVGRDAASDRISELLNKAAIETYWLIR